MPGDLLAPEAAARFVAVAAAGRLQRLAEERAVGDPAIGRPLSVRVDHLVRGQGTAEWSGPVRADAIDDVVDRMVEVVLDHIEEAEAHHEADPGSTNAGSTEPGSGDPRSSAPSVHRFEIGVAGRLGATVEVATDPLDPLRTIDLRRLVVDTTPSTEAAAVAESGDGWRGRVVPASRLLVDHPEFADELAALEPDELAALVDQVADASLRLGAITRLMRDWGSPRRRIDGRTLVWEPSFPQAKVGLLAAVHILAIGAAALANGASPGERTAAAFVVGVMLLPWWVVLLMALRHRVVLGPDEVRVRRPFRTVRGPTADVVAIDLDPPLGPEAGSNRRRRRRRRPPTLRFGDGRRANLSYALVARYQERSVDRHAAHHLADFLGAELVESAADRR